MELVKYLKTLSINIADIIFPISCLICGRDGKFLCETCETKIEKIQNQLCIVCQKPAPFGKTHPNCASKNKLDGIISALPYRDPKVAKLIETFKYKFIDALNPHFSKFVQEAIINQGLKDYFSDFTLIPVPLHKRRFNWRGFNQAELIGKQISQDLNIHLDNQLVTRVKFTIPQTQLKKEKRFLNIQNAFSISNPNIKNKYLIVDDVVTTGATLNEIAKLLKKSGAQEVWAITIAHG
jgi:competence protein ComFC